MKNAVRFPSSLFPSHRGEVQASPLERRQTAERAAELSEVCWIMGNCRIRGREKKHGQLPLTHPSVERITLRVFFQTFSPLKRGLLHDLEFLIYDIRFVI